MRTATPRRLSRQHRPAGMALEDWQRELRRQYGREQPLRLKNIGSDPVFSDYQVANPQRGSTYRVAIRGAAPGDNYCSCPDFSTNALGTCKHVEFVLGRLERTRRTRSVLEGGFQPPYSEVVLQYGAKREVRFRPGGECPRELASLAATYFGPDGLLRPGAFAHFEEFLSQAARIGHDLRCYDDVLGFVAEV